MEKEISVKGIVLAGFPYGEYGKRLLILTDKLGKVTVFARSIAKQNSKMIGFGRIFTCAEFLLSEGKGAYSLHGARAIDSFDEIPGMPEASFTGQYALEAADWFSREGMPEQDAKSMLNLLFVTLSALRKNEIPSFLIRRIFELRMLVHEGIYTEQPEIRTAVSENCWKYAVSCPLSRLFDKAGWSGTDTADFCESVSRLWEREAGHHFHSEAFL